MNRAQKRIIQQSRRKFKGHKLTKKEKKDYAKGEKLIAEGYCSKREDETHCVHWWDGDPCCSCGSNAGDIDESN